MRHRDGFEFLHGVRPPGSRRDIVVADQQESRDARLRQAHDPPAPLALESRHRRAVFVRIPGKQNHIHMLIDGRIHNHIQRLEEVLGAHGQPALRVMPPVRGDIDMRVSKMQNPCHKKPFWKKNLPQRRKAR